MISRESGIDDARLGSALSPKVLETLSVLVAHGHTSIANVVAAVGGEDAVAGSSPRPETASNPHPVEADLALEKKTREFLESEVTELQDRVSKLLQRWREQVRRVAVLQRQLRQLRASNERVISATRDGVRSLQGLRDGLKGTDRGAKELAEHARRLRAIVEAVQAVREVPAEPAVARRGGHDAR